jgi:HSP20 family protein
MTARWDPVAEMRSLRQAMNRLLDEPVVRPVVPTRPALPVAYELGESADEVRFSAAIPGIDPSTLELTVQRGVLSVRGQLSATMTPEERARYRWYHRGLPEGQFSFSVALPAEVDTGAAQASYENGILTVRLPKASAVKPKTIPVKATTAR